MDKKSSWAYLGKTKLYNFLKEEGYNVPRTMREMEYHKYRGNEWLNCDDVKIWCVRGKSISVSIYEYDEETDKRHETEYYCYMLIDGIWKKFYQRIGSKITTIAV